MEPITDFPEEIYLPEKSYVTAPLFNGLRGSATLVDVRSPAEYARGHIPGAVNIPIFNDKEREKVGTIFAKKGKQEAVYEGLDLIGGSLSEKLREALKRAENGKLLLYCWRGGMRSSSMAWLFSLAGIKTVLLEGGYKAYRNHILKELSAFQRVIILGGYTGSGKTEILKEIAKEYPVVDLEGIAHHRGSAFGKMSEPQPSTEHFANLLYDKVAGISPETPLFVEDESRSIGSVFIPDEFHKVMQLSSVIAINIPAEQRVNYLAGLYGESGKDYLTASVHKIEKRLGGDRAKKAIGFIETGDLRNAAAILLDYYDSSYRYNLTRKPVGKLSEIESPVVDASKNASLVIAEAKRRSLL